MAYRLQAKRCIPESHDTRRSLALEGQQNRPKLRIVTIPFDESDCKRVIYLHEDALLVIILVTNFTTRRILIDNGSLAYILFGKHSPRWA